MSNIHGFTHTIPVIHFQISEIQYLYIAFNPSPSYVYTAHLYVQISSMYSLVYLSISTPCILPTETQHSEVLVHRRPKARRRKQRRKWSVLPSFWLSQCPCLFGLCRWGESMEVEIQTHLNTKSTGVCIVVQYMKGFIHMHIL